MWLMSYIEDNGVVKKKQKVDIWGLLFKGFLETDQEDVTLIWETKSGEGEGCNMNFTVSFPLFRLFLAELLLRCVNIK